MDVKSYCQSLPKLELHAHLNGSLTANTLKKLYKLQNPDSGDCADIVMSIENLSSLGECFKVFDIAHSLTDSPDAIFICTYDVIKEFKDDNVIYLEIRSTPRAVDGKMSKHQYVEAIIKAFETCKTDFPDILVKLLISVNRKHGYEAAQENVQLAMEFSEKFPNYVVGIDLSGDPMTGDAFIDLLRTAKLSGLKIAAHCAEVPNEKEAIDILSFKPDRLGHCTCIHPNLQGSQKLFDMLLESKIPTELCLTSNVKCKTVPSYLFHQFKYLYEAGHPVCLATDDKGVFNTSLSEEFQIASSTFNLGREALLNLCVSAVQYTFATDEERNMLLTVLNSFNSQTP